TAGVFGFAVGTGVTTLVSFQLFWPFALNVAKTTSARIAIEVCCFQFTGSSLVNRQICCCLRRTLGALHPHCHCNWPLSNLRGGEIFMGNRRRKSRNFIADHLVLWPR